MTVTYSNKIGKIITSVTPLDDEKLHLVNGSLLTKTDYPVFYNYIKDLYEDNPDADYFNVSLPFIQPILSSSGTIGGDSFAVTSIPAYGDGYATYYPFAIDANQDLGRTWAVYDDDADYIMYNPTPLCITNIQITNRNESPYSRAIESGKAYASNDNSTWTELTTFTNNMLGTNQVWDINLSTNTDYYKYYKLAVHNSYQPDNLYAMGIGKIDLTATQSGGTPEANWQAIVSRYGVCGKFVYDAENETVRIPKYGSQITTSNTTSLDVYYYIQVKE